MLARRLAAILLAGSLAVASVWLLLGAAATASAAALSAAQTARVELHQTVGLQPNICATTDTLVVTEGVDVVYCFDIYNIGDITLTRHSVTDVVHVTLINAYSLTLAPGAGARFFVTTTANSSVVNEALYTAYNPGPVDVATDTVAATIIVIKPRLWMPMIFRPESLGH